MKNRILSILCIFLLLIFVFINNSFAYTSTEDIVCKEPTNTYLATALAELQQTYPEEDYYYTYGYSYGPRCFYLVFFEKQYLKINPYIYYTEYTYQNNDYYDLKVSDDNTKVPCAVYKIYDGRYALEGNYSYDDHVPAFTKVSNSTEPVEFTANFNVYNNSSCTDFFFNTPVTGILAPILEKVEMSEPILTTVVGLVGLLIPLLICLLGFWKAWGLLSKILHKS